MLKQAKASNPDATVILVGDKHCHIPGRWLEQHDYRDYYDSALEFKKRYKHNSVNPYKFELRCFQRWFILRDFIAARGIKRCAHVERDVMIYCDLDKEFKRLGGFDFSLSKPTPQHDHSFAGFFLLNNIGALDEFCRFLMDLYKREDITISSRWGGRPHFSDMYAFELFSRQGRYKIVNTAAIQEGAFYDHYMGLDQGMFEMRDGVKRITFKGNTPYGKMRATGEEVRFKTLHFGGITKSDISRYYKADKQKASLREMLNVWHYLYLKRFIYRLESIITRVLSRECEQ